MNHVCHAAGKFKSHVDTWWVLGYPRLPIMEGSGPAMLVILTSLGQPRLCWQRWLLQPQ